MPNSGPGRYWIGEEEKEELLEVITAGHLFRYGKPGDAGFIAKTYTLEQAFAKYCGVKHCVASSSGTASLLLALKGIQLAPGDEVIVPTYTFVATYSSLIFAGGVPILTDIDESLTLDPQDIERRISPRTKAIMPVHMLGNPCDMDAIMEIAQRHGLYVVEDACQANGASYHGKKVGSIGTAGGFSLNMYKTINCGDGGLTITDDTEVYERAFAFHDQGHLPNRQGVEIGHRQTLGLNFRMNELSAAVAIAQLRKLDRITSTLREKKRKLKAAIGPIPGIKYRKLNDPDGECATLLTLICDSETRAKAMAQKMGTTTLEQSGWHVYANMEHVMRYLKERKLPNGRGAYPQTDNILSRALNLSVGVTDNGLSATFGININSTDDEILQVADSFKAICQETKDL